jgi:hypothetical protein
MPRRPDVARHRLWQQRFQRFARSGLKVAAFCEREGISQPSFYAWRRRLRAGVPGPRFVPVRVTPATAAPVELLLPSGCIVRLLPGCELAWVRGLLDLLGVPSC